MSLESHGYQTKFYPRVHNSHGQTVHHALVSKNDGYVENLDTQSIEDEVRYAMETLAERGKIISLFATVLPDSYQPKILITALLER